MKILVNSLLYSFLYVNLTKNINVWINGHTLEIIKSIPYRRSLFKRVQNK